ncbi:hypothetical protein GIB67_038391 [Kingdonia uniflora]|uniref:ATP-dependent DNA helicase n=1 Tax=Kingdonia uniflora TaxID=39325 RepID=A0A7J7NPJ0_9MAGN|nr:hypothetical protein GIB67_038391 [Kingdonia uniflora]
MAESWKWTHSWLNNAPSLTGFATDPTAKARIMEYFDKLVCAMNPDPSNISHVQFHPCARNVTLEDNMDDDDANYVNLVNWVMRHSRCGINCLHYHKTTKQMRTTYKPITREQCRKMQDDFKDTKLIIIDEYSMLGRSMIATVDLRCRDIFGVDQPFGGVYVVLVGDMRQLPPVFNSPLYSKNWNHMQQCGGITYAGFEHCVKLSRIFRQAGDEQAPFRDALGRLSSGTCTFDDWKLFKTRDCSILRNEEKEEFRHALHLFPTIIATNEHNRTRLIELEKPVERIPSTNNLSWKTSSGTTCQRTQLPLLLCWAITVHKSQGLTLDRVIGDAGDRKSLGLTFVALSRTRKLSDLAFKPMFTFERLQKLGKCAGLNSRMEEEECLRLMSLLPKD